MNIRPLNNYVIAEVEKPKEQKIGSIIIPETISQNNIQRNKIRNKSESCRQVSVGDDVISRTGSGTKFMLDGKEYIALDEKHDLICVIED